MGVEEGTLIDKVIEKYGDDALVKKTSNENAYEEEESKGEDEESEDLLGKGP